MCQNGLVSGSRFSGEVPRWFFFGGGGERWMVAACGHSGNGVDADGGDDIGPNDGTLPPFSLFN